MPNYQFFLNRVRQVSLLATLSFMVVLPLHAGWEVSWIERFDGGSVNSDNWTPQTDANFNNEVQCYTDDETSANRNYEVSDGTLKITARRQQIICPGQNNTPRNWTSGRLNSKDKAEFLYGRVEARIRFDELRGGTWPAFWMLGNRIRETPIKGDNDSIQWPDQGAGEIDIFEWFGNGGDSYITNFYNANGCAGEKRYPYPGGAPDVQSFHDYAIEWTADEITMFIDDIAVITHDLSNCPQYEEPMFVLLNVAMGGSLGGAIEASLNTATMEVDYVAHCVASDSNNAQRCNESTPQGADDDGDGILNILDICPATPANAQVDARGCQFFTEPQSAAPLPTIAAENVISIYSDSYTNIDGVNTNPDWGQATQVTEVQIGSDNVLKYSGLNYQGTEFKENRQDVTGLDNIHIDYWSQDSTSLRIYVISPGPLETFFDVAVEIQAWQQLVIPLSTYASVVDLSDVNELKIDGNGTVFIDNIYFAAEAVVAPVDSDGDGVIDSADQCPNTPANTSVDAVGCAVVTPPADSDGDGVIDSADQCPNTPANTSVDAVGCAVVTPPADNDGDGVIDSADQCPNTPANTTVDDVGCVLPSLPVPEQDSGGGSMNQFLLLSLSILFFARRKYGNKR
jgi:beta-glucanase (GH16 family)